LQGCKWMCILKPQQLKLVNSSMPPFVHCEDRRSHDTGLGALHGCKFISEYYKFKKNPIPDSSWNWTPSVNEKLHVHAIWREVHICSVQTLTPMNVFYILVPINRSYCYIHCTIR
jgi:hypothetical protein